MTITQFLAVEITRLLGWSWQSSLKEAAPVEPHQKDDEGEPSKLKRDGTPPPDSCSKDLSQGSISHAGRTNPKHVADKASSAEDKQNRWERRSSQPCSHKQMVARLGHVVMRLPLRVGTQTTPCSGVLLTPRS